MQLHNYKLAILHNLCYMHCMQVEKKKRVARVVTPLTPGQKVVAVISGGGGILFCLFGLLGCVVGKESPWVILILLILLLGLIVNLRFVFKYGHHAPRYVEKFDPDEDIMGSKL